MFVHLCTTMFVDFLLNVILVKSLFTEEDFKKE